MSIIKINIPPFIGVEFSAEDIEGFRKQLKETATGLFKAKDFVGCYHIIAKHSGKALDVDSFSKEDCANIFQYELHGGDNQIWILVKAKDGYYYFFAKHSGKCLDVESYKQDNGANVWQHSFHGGDNQQWKLKETENGYFYILARHSGKALDVQDYSQANGANVFQYELHRGDNQKWKLQPVA
jgi:hypothetical protein